MGEEDEHAVPLDANGHGVPQFLTTTHQPRITLAAPTGSKLVALVDVLTVSDLVAMSNASSNRARPDVAPARGLR
jgi:hypothetical protein